MFPMYDSMSHTLNGEAVPTTCPVLTDSFGSQYMTLLRAARQLEKGRRLDEIDYLTYTECQLLMSIHAEVRDG